MKIKSLLTSCLVLLILVSTGATLSAAPADSSTFPYQQNGTLGDTADFVFWGNPMTDAGDGILDFNAGGMDSPAWLGEAASLRAVGYTIEMRLKITSSGGWGFGVMPSTGAHLSWFSVRDGDVMSQYGPSGTVLSWGGGNNTSAFHVFRIAHDSNTMYYSIWKDGVLLSTTANVIEWGGLLDANTFVSFGTVSGAGPSGQLDYIRWTPGVYEPQVPSLTGNVVLDGFSGDVSSVGISVQLNDGTPYYTLLDAQGNFTLDGPTNGILNGTYNVRIKSPQCLAKTTYDVMVNGATNMGTVILGNGDCDGDNEVTSTDLSILGLALGLVGD